MIGVPFGKYSQKSGGPARKLVRNIPAGGGGSGPTGKSYDFDGVDDYALANGAASAIDFNNTAHTVSVWAKVPPTGVALSALWAFTNSAASSSRYWLAITAAGAINLYGWSNSSGVYVFGGAGGAVVGSGLDDDAWHNIVVTYDGSATLKIYVDGSPPFTVVVGAGTLTSDTLSFGARRVSGATSFPADCLIHQASVYTSELTGAQVAAIYNNNRPVDESALTPSPTNYYRFGNGDTLFPTLKDYGSGGADGTAVNMAPTAIVDDYPQGMSYLFDGVSDYIQADAVVASTGTFDWQTDAQSISVWFKTSNTAAQALWSFGHRSNTGWFTLQVEGGASAKVKLRGQYNLSPLFGRADATSSPNGANGEFWVLAGDPNGIDPADDEWHHVVATFRGAASTAQAVKLYIDGNYVGFSESRSTGFDVSDFSIAALRYDGASRVIEHFAGYISQVSMYTSELSASDVTALYAGGSMPDPRSLSIAPQHLFRFGAGDGLFPTLVDYGSTPQNGTAVNMTSADVKGDSPT